LALLVKQVEQLDIALKTAEAADRHSNECREALEKVCAENQMLEDEVKRLRFELGKARMLNQRVVDTGAMDEGFSTININEMYRSKTRS
jgi:hypothetical protein